MTKSKFLILSLVMLALPQWSWAAGIYLLNAGTPSPASVRTLLNLGGANGAAFQLVRLGTQLADKKVQVMKASYDFAVQGGSDVASLNLKDTDLKDAVIPKSAIIKQVLIDTITAPVGTNATITLAADTPGADLKAATAITSYTAGSLQAGTPVGTAATMHKMLADRTITMRVLGNNLTAGKFNVFIEYYLSNL